MSIEVFETTDARSRRGRSLRGLLKKTGARSLAELRSMLSKLGPAERTEIEAALDRLDEGAAR